MSRARAVPVLAATFVVTLLVFPWSDERVTDLNVYRFDASYFLHGQIPYRDVLFEYPPLAAPVIGLPGLAGTDYPTYQLAFAALMLAAGVAVLLLTGALARSTGGDERRALAVVALAPLATGAMIGNHFDLAPVALTLAALVLLVRARPVAGMAVLGLAVATKGFPIVVAPVALAWFVARGEWRQALRGGATLAAVCAVAVGGTIAISPSGALDTWRWQTARPVQVESIPAVALRALGGTRHVKSNRADGIVHPASGPVTGAVAMLGLAAVALLAAGVARRPGPRELVLGSLAAVAAFATFGKVISPQYLVWTLPLAALALAWRRHALFGVLAGATLLTFVEFPARYSAVVHGVPAAVALVAVRDALLVAAVALSARDLLAGYAARGATGAGVSASRARATTSSP
ncbi:MAG: hypothetical protein QOG63_2406 [Thermoleophilaceae bacterium]|nr:hypothetical protein [Thermoleophilaceae bacterium]